MKTNPILRLAFIAATCSAAFAQEKIVTVIGKDFSTVQRMLDEGWTVKAQSSTQTSGSTAADPFHVFTLTPPPPDVLAKRTAEAKAAFDKRRAEWLAKQPKVEKEGR